MARSAPESKVGAERARMFRLTYASPIRGMTPAKLVNVLDAYERGFLREAALLVQKILARDDQAKPCDSKRRRAVTGLEWEILPLDDSPEAAEDKQALEACYNNLTAVDALNQNKRGGIRALFRLMMSAVPLEYAPFEIVWQPDAPGGLTAEFRHLPLQFFENTTGSLRYLASDSVLYGADLDEFFGEGGWMVCAGEGMIEALAIAWMFKTPNGLKAWVNFSEKFGIPGLHGKTAATKGSAEWEAMKDALTGFGEDLAILTNESGSITPIEIKNSGASPHRDLVDRMDRAISRLFFGGDLATMSKEGSAVGSNAQAPDAEYLVRDDAAMITDTLQYFVDRRVIEYLRGPGVAPKAFFKLLPPAELNVERELKTDEFLIARGVEVAKSDLRSRYGRSEPEAGEPLASAPVAAPPLFPAANEAAASLTRAAFRSNARADIVAAKRDAFAPLATRLAEIIGIADPTAQDAALLKFRHDLPRFAREHLITEPEIEAWVRANGTAMIDGAATAAAARKTSA